MFLFDYSYIFFIINIYEINKDNVELFFLDRKWIFNVLKL